MEIQEKVMGIALEKFTWNIENFSQVRTKTLSSKTFQIGGYNTWKIVLHPMGENVNNFSLHIEITNRPAYGWKVYAYFRVSLINQLQTRNSIVKETQQKFHGGNKSWNSSSFIPLTEFLDPIHGYLVKDTCIIEAQIATSTDVAFTILDNVELNEPEHLGIALNIDAATKSRSGKEKIESSSDESDPQSSTTCESSSKGKEAQGSDLTLRDILDFNKLGNEEKTYFPLLQEVCKHHPSLLLIWSQRERSYLSKVSAFISLGKVLHFLRKTKVRDMNEDACNELCTLWEELKSSGFDLAWLEPHVENALGVKKAQVERTLALKNLQNSVVDMEIEMKRLREELAAIKAKFEVASKALIEARKGVIEMDIDVVLGYSM